MNIDENLAVAIGGGFFVGVLVGYALKKVIKVLAIVVGLFFAGLVYLQYQQILSVNWNKLQVVSQGAVSTLANATTQIPSLGSSGLNSSSSGVSHTTHLALTNLGIPLTGSMAMGFAVGFMKG